MRASRPDPDPLDHSPQRVRHKRDDLIDANGAAVRPRPRYLTIADEDPVDEVLELVRRAGWTIEGFGGCNIRATSPDGHAVLAWLPEHNDFAPQVSGHPTYGVEWVIRVYKPTRRTAIAYELIFTLWTPAEAVAAALRSLLEPVTSDEPQTDASDHA